MRNRYVIAASKVWDNNIISDLSKAVDAEFILIMEKERLSYGSLSEIKPRYIFFSHWSFIIPEDVYKNFECIIFHMTDVPFGRGGSPLQNLIERGIYQTKISALKTVKELDAGDVYLKRELSLYGSAEEIYIRATKIIAEMIKSIIQTKPNPKVQSGEVTIFKRRKPEQGNLEKLDSLEKVFDYIRMLDAENYPNAFLETEHFRFEFTRASLRKDIVIADVKIIERNKATLE